MTMQVYAPAPIKRMSILERRKGDERTFFSRHWREIHGGMVSKLPHLHAYIQNHVQEEFPTRHPAFPGDGIVEQLWRSTAEMQKGYTSPVVGELIADEVNYLGHGSNYAILAQGPLREAPGGNKLLIAVRHGGKPGLADAIAEKAARLCADIVRDDVIATITKANFLPAQPHPVDMFLHLYCADSADATRVGQALTEAINGLEFGQSAACAVWRMSTATIVTP